MILKKAPVILNDPLLISLIRNKKKKIRKDVST